MGRRIKEGLVSHCEQEHMTFTRGRPYRDSGWEARVRSAAGRHGLSTTCAGTLLKQQIPIRTFKEWNETQPGLTFSGTGAPTVTPT